jgi:hypothetical protein
MSNKLTITEALLLIESLDTTHKTEKLGTAEYSDYHKRHGITDHAIYSLDDGKAGHLHILKREKAYEIHHGMGELDNEISGEWIPSGKHNAKFAGTMYRVAKNILNSGNRVRVVGNHTNGMFQHYNKISNILAKREGYSVSSPKQYTLDSPKSKDYSEITISSHNKSSLLEDISISMTLNNSEQNNYGLDLSIRTGPYDSIDQMMEQYFNCK